MIPNKKTRYGVIILVQKVENKIPFFLIVKQRNGNWSLPSGGKEEGETDLEAANRELFEETGIKGMALKTTKVINEFSYDKNTKGLQVGFKGTTEDINTLKTEMPEEIKDIKWVTKEKAKEYLIRENQYEVFESLINA